MHVVANQLSVLRHSAGQALRETQTDIVHQIGAMQPNAAEILSFAAL